MTSATDNILQFNVNGTAHQLIIDFDEQSYQNTINKSGTLNLPNGKILDPWSDE